MTDQQAERRREIPEAHLIARNKYLGPGPSAIESRKPLTSYICQIWSTAPNIGVYHQLVGAMMTHPADSYHFYIATELSFLVGLYRRRLHLEGVHDFYAGT